MKKFTLGLVMATCVASQCYTFYTFDGFKKTNQLEIQRLENEIHLQNEELKKHENEIANQEKLRQASSEEQLEYIESSVSTIQKRVQDLTLELDTALSQFNYVVDTIGGGSNFK